MSLIKEEKWVEAKGYEGYLVSNLGRIISKRTNRLRSVQVDSSGYKFVDFFVKGIRKRGYIANLVAHGFLDNPNNNERATFIDGDLNNVSVDNLRWVSITEEKERAYEFRVNVNMTETFVINAKTEDEAKRKFLDNTSSYSSLVDSLANHESYDGFYIEEINEVD